MSKITQLIQEFCPNGVEYKYLWEVTAWDKRFNGVEKSKQNQILSYKHISSASLKSLKTSTGEVRLLSTGKYDGYTTKELSIDYLNEGEVITIPSGGSANIKYFDGLFVDSGNILAGTKDHNVLALKFLYYYLLSINEVIEKAFRGSGVKHPNMSAILELKVPVPPIAIQRKIIQALDSFTELEASLKAELELRKSQFEYYRDELLSFENSNEVEWKPLGKIGEFIRGKRFTKEDYADTGVGVIHYGEIYTRYGTSTDTVISYVREDMRSKLRFAKPGDVIITDVGETVDDVGKAVAWVGSEDVAIHDHCYAFRHKMNPKYVAYCMQTNKFRNDKAKYIARTKVNTLLINGFSKVTIPVPSMSDQDRIVSILDKFDRLVNDKSVGLPAEIIARKKQYKFYRSRLLEFQELTA